MPFQKIAHGLLALALVTAPQLLGGSSSVQTPASTQATLPESASTSVTATPASVTRQFTIGHPERTPARERPLPSITDWVLVGVTFAYAVVAFFTLRAIKRQAELAETAALAAKESAYAARRQAETLEKTLVATERAAEAAKQSADSLTNAERPHVTLGHFESRDILGLLDEEKTPYITFDFVNHGRTPSFLVEFSVRFRLMGAVIPESPDYGLPWKYPEGVILGPNGRTGREIRKLEEGILTKDAINALRLEQRHLVFFGYVVYRSALTERTHEHRFCLVYQPEHKIFTFTGPETYNMYT